MRLKFSLKFGLEVVFFASIPWLSHRSEEKSTDPTKIQWRYGEDPAMRWKFSFKSGLEVVFLASISWLSHRSGKKSTDLAKIHQRFREIRRRFSNFRWRFGEDLEVETHSDFDRPDRCPPEPDPTRPEIFGGLRQVV